MDPHPFDIVAKAPAGATRRDAPSMLRTLLAERFRLRIRPETRTIPVYALTLAGDGTLGPNLRRSKYDCAALVIAGRSMRETDAGTRAVCAVPVNFNEIRSGVMTRIFAGPMAQLVRQIQGNLDRPVIDETRLEGNFEWKLTFAISPLKSPDTPSIYIALEEQLGLKLASRSAPYDVFVIESVAPPSPD